MTPKHTGASLVEKITFLDRLFKLAKQEYASNKESKEKDFQVDAALSKLNAL